MVDHKLPAWQSPPRFASLPWALRMAHNQFRSKGKFRRKSVANLPCFRSRQSRDWECASGSTSASDPAGGLETTGSEISLSLEGHRVTELGFTCKQLSRGCHRCKKVLLLPNVQGERQYGLASLLDIVCDSKDCGAFLYFFLLVLFFHFYII